jgi:hypothetical protein
LLARWSETLLRYGIVDRDCDLCDSHSGLEMSRKTIHEKYLNLLSILLLAEGF